MPGHTIGPFPHYSREEKRYKVEFVNDLDEAFDEHLKGYELPITARLEELQQNTPESNLSILENTRIYTDLPAVFFETFLRIQTGESPILSIPKIGENKNISVLSCLKNNENFTKGLLALSNWRELGWESQEQYQAWLNSPVLFAFSHCNHYCSATRIFDVDAEAMEANPDRKFRFKLQMEKDVSRKTNIYTVTGYEFRNIRMAPPVVGDALCSNIQRHTKKTISQMLTVAQNTATTDIVLIPFGTGVFVPSNFAIIKDYLIAGISEGLQYYKGPKITIHWCGPTGKLQVNNDCVEIIQYTGKDAYTVANTIQDQGNLNGQKTEDGRVLKSMLVNAGDNDWTALLDPEKTPGQFYRGHTLFNETSDEYYALVTEFPFHSIQNLLKLFPNLVTAGKLVQQLRAEKEPELAWSPDNLIEEETPYDLPVQIILYQARNGELALKFPNQEARDRFRDLLEVEALNKFQTSLLRTEENHRHCRITYRSRGELLFIPCRMTLDTQTNQQQLVPSFSSIGQAQRFYKLLGIGENGLGYMRSANHPLGNYPNIYLAPGKLLSQGESITVDIALGPLQSVEPVQATNSRTNRYGYMFKPEPFEDNEEPEKVIAKTMQ